MNTQNNRIVIPCSKSLEFIFVHDIIRCEGLQNYTRIHLNSGHCILSSCNIGSYRTAFEFLEFFSCHKSHLINTTKIKRYHKDGQVEMSDGSRVPVSRRKKEMFFKSIIYQGDFISINRKKRPQLQS